MKWSELTPAERNMLVAEKVMGWQPKECDGEVWEVSGGWQCSDCGLSGDWTGKDFDRFASHLQVPPRYSESMDAAWLIVEKMKTYQRSLLASTRLKPTIADYFLVRLWESVDKRGLEALFAYTPERLCLAALRAVGVEIET